VRLDLAKLVAGSRARRETWRDLRGSRARRETWRDLEQRLRAAGAHLRPHKATSHRKWELPSGATFTTSGQHLSEDAPLNVVKALDRLLVREQRGRMKLVASGNRTLPTDNNMSAPDVPWRNKEIRLAFFEADGRMGRPSKTLTMPDATAIWRERFLMEAIADLWGRRKHPNPAYLMLDRRVEPDLWFWNEGFENLNSYFLVHEKDGMLHVKYLRREPTIAPTLSGDKRLTDLVRRKGTRATATSLAMSPLMHRRGGRNSTKVNEIVSALADAWTEECDLDDEGGIDRGYCTEFADDLAGKIRETLGGEPRIVETVDVVLEVPEHLRETLRDQDHSWVLYDGRHYDAETPHGEKHWWHLPIFVMSGFADRLNDALRRKKKARKRMSS
jgi:hypothetical protein